jgi:hypothetical protein
MRKDCDEGCVMERREARAEARGRSCFNMTAELPEDTKSDVKGQSGVAMGENCRREKRRMSSSDDQLSTELRPALS